MMDPDWIVRLAAACFIAWLIASAWWAGRVVACLESIARSLREKP
jgi:hypothetical protein